jgi:hypothetical protein
VQIAGRLSKAGKPIYVPFNAVAMAIFKRRYEAVDKDGEDRAGGHQGAFRQARTSRHARRLLSHHEALWAAVDYASRVSVGPALTA